MKKEYGLLGRNISYSFSEKYFNERFQNEGVNAQYYTFDLQEILELKDLLKEKTLSGLNVTIPYKQDVFPFLDDLSAEVEEIGAVNVIKFEEDGTLSGHNSDYYGFKNSLLESIKELPKKALVLGTGGASKAVVKALKDLGIEWKYVSRSPKSGQYTYEDLNDTIIKEYHLIVNCSPVGTFPNTEQCPNLPYEHITNQHIMFDLIYNPEVTTFMQKGLDKGAKAINGYRMLILQAEKAWEIWNS